MYKVKNQNFEYMRLGLTLCSVKVIGIELGLIVCVCVCVCMCVYVCVYAFVVTGRIEQLIRKCQFKMELKGGRNKP